MLQGGSHIFYPPFISTSVHVATAIWPYVISGIFSSEGGGGGGARACAPSIGR